MKKTITTQTSLFFFDEQEKNSAKIDFVNDFGTTDTLLSECLDISKNTKIKPKKKKNSEHSLDSMKSCKALIKELIKSKNLPIKEIEMSKYRSAHTSLQRSKEETIIADRYIVKELVAEGACGLIYKGFHKQLNIDIAIKVLKEEWVTRPTIRNRFIREGQLMATIHHPNIVRVYDVGEFENRIYLVMDYINGITLENYKNDGSRASLIKSVQLMSQISEALSAIHERGIIHRDIKPSNIMIAKDCHAILMDFGIAKEETSTSKKPNLTTTHSFLGTPHFMAPEQFTAPEKVTKATDVYALGVTFYNFITNELPFPGKTVLQIFDSHKSLIPTPPHDRCKRLPQKISNILVKMIEKQPEHRFPDGNAVKLELQKAQLDRSAPRLVLVAISIIVVVLVILAILGIKTNKIVIDKKFRVNLQTVDSFVEKTKRIFFAEAKDHD